MQQQSQQIQLQSQQHQQELEARKAEQDRQAQMEQQRIEIQKAYHQSQMAMQQQKLEEAQKITDMRVQTAAQKFQAQQRYQQDLQGFTASGMEPGEAAIRSGIQNAGGMGFSGQGIAALGKTSTGMAQAKLPQSPLQTQPVLDPMTQQPMPGEYSYPGPTGRPVVRRSPTTAVKPDPMETTGISILERQIAKTDEMLDTPGMKEKDKAAMQSKNDARKRQVNAAFKKRGTDMPYPDAEALPLPKTKSELIPEKLLPHQARDRPLGMGSNSSPNNQWLTLSHSRKPTLPPRSLLRRRWESSRYPVWERMTPPPHWARALDCWSRPLPPSPRPPGFSPRVCRWWTTTFPSLRIRVFWGRRKSVAGRACPLRSPRTLPRTHWSRRAKRRKITGSPPFPAPMPREVTWLAQGAEQATGMAGYAVAGPAAPLVMGARSYADHIVNDYEEGKKKGLSEDESGSAALGKAMASGAFQAAVFEVLPKPLKTAAEKLIVNRFGEGALANFLGKRIGSAASTAGLFESSHVGENVVSGRPVTEGAGTAALSGALFGALTPFVETKREQVKLPERPPATREERANRYQEVEKQVSAGGRKLNKLEGDIPGFPRDVFHAREDGSIDVSLPKLDEYLERYIDEGVSPEKAIERAVGEELFHAGSFDIPGLGKKPPSIGTTTPLWRSRHINGSSWATGPKTPKRLRCTTPAPTTIPTWAWNLPAIGSRGCPRWGQRRCRRCSSRDRLRFR